MDSSFKNSKTLQERKNICDDFLNKYPSRIPVICEKCKNSDLPDLNKSLRSVPKDTIASSFIFSIRRNINLSQENSLFLMINNKIAVQGNTTMFTYYSKYKDPEDGFLYISYDTEKVWG